MEPEENSGRNWHETLSLGFALVFVIVIAIWFAVAGRNSDEPGSGHVWSQPEPLLRPADKPVELPVRADLKLLESEWEYADADRRYITGLITNTGDRVAGVIVVTFSLFDRTGARIQDTHASIDDLRPHTAWRFRCAVWDSRAEKAELKDIIAR